MASKLSQLRNGVPPHKVIEIRDMKFAVVIVPSDIIQSVEQTVEEYAQENPKKVNNQVRAAMFDHNLVFHCLRDPENLSAKVAESVKEVAETFDQEDISRITTTYGELMVNKAPKLELMTGEQFEELKKYLGEVQLSDLSTVSLVHLSNFHQQIVSEI